VPEAPARQADRPLADFSIVTSAVDELKDEERPAIAPPVQDIAPPVRSQPVRTARNASAAPAAARNSRTRQTAAQANPSRVWVQVATGSNRAGLSFSLGQFRDKAPALLNGRAAYIAPWNATNRLLVGPFPNETAANGFVRQLSARGVQSYSWTSEAGQRIDQLAAASNEPRSTSRTRTAASDRTDSGRRNARAGSGSRNERSAAGTGRTRGGAANSRTASGSSRNSAASTRSARAASSNERGSSRTARNGKPPANASARSSRGGSSGQQRPSSRRGR
jgi:hypothetical protein